MRIEQQVSGLDFLNRPTNRPMIDLSYGGQQGYMPQLAGIDGDVTFDEWISNAAYVQNQTIPIVLRTPEFFNLLDPVLGKRLRKYYIDLFTVHPMTIQGIDATVTLETDEHNIGAGGQFQEEFVKATRGRGTPTFEFQEKLGKPVNRFLDFLIRYCVMDPDTQSALLGTVPEIRKNFKGNLATPDYNTGTILFVELDSLNINVIDAFLYTNFAPKTAGEVTAKKDLTASKELKRYSVECTGICETNDSVRDYAQSIVDNMTIFTKNPDTAPIFVNHTDAMQTLSDSDNAGFNREAISNVPKANQ